jgi:methionine-rich copper-binding protein CopC
MRRVLLLIGAALATVAAPALAHGDLSSSNPEVNGLLEDPPSVVVLNFAEPPSEQKITVLDGCHRNVAQEVEVEGARATVSLAGSAQPGHFRVRYRNVSSVDGHAINGRYAFHVLGKKNCREGNTEEPGEGGDRAAPPGPPDDGSSFPVVPVALGTIGVVGVALLVRLATRS